MTNFDARLRELLDKQDIYEVLTRYCRGVDRGDAELIRSVYHDDAIDDHGIWKGLGVEFADWIVGVLKDTKQCMHLIGNVRIDLQGDVANSETYCISINDDGVKHQTVDVRYIDRFERRQNVWKIAARLVVFDVSRIEPRTESYGKGVGDLLTWGKKSRADASYRTV